MLQKITLSWLFLFVILVSSCVSSKKYKAATTESQMAKTANEELNKKYTDLQTQLNGALSSNKLLTDERDHFQKETDSTNAQLKQMTSAVDEYVSANDDVQKKVADKMADYAERGVSVQNKDGMVHVSIEDKLLFKKGSRKIGKDGETALGTLSSVLSENPTLKIMVVGHTDDRTAKGSDQWTLSTERANSVVRMLKDMKIDPIRLTSAGQGANHPVGDNTTAEGRAQNKRTEIILAPADAFKLLNKDTK